MSMKRIMKVLTLLFVLLFFSVQPGIADESVPDEMYVIGHGDILQVLVWKDDALTRQVTVLPDGTFQFPLLGNIVAYGKTVNEIRADLEKRIEKYVPDPVISVEVMRPASMVIYVIGRVHRPGHVNLNQNINVLQALSMAGGLTPFAEGDEIKIFRKEAEEDTVFHFDYDEVLEGENPAQNIALKRGDIIVVP